MEQSNENEKKNETCEIFLNDGPMKNVFEKLSQLGKRKQHKYWKWRKNEDEISKVPCSKN